MKVLITADLHVGDYQAYNPTPYFRLFQFEKLGKYLVNKCIEQNIKEFWIAGDLLYIARPAPIVMYVLQEFLKNFSQHGITVRAILGNHDVTVRTNNVQIDEYSKYSLVPLLESTGTKIYFDDIVQIENKTVHFHSWVPSNKFEPRKADYLIAHGDSCKRLSPFTNPESFIDYSGYSKAFIGHIHVPYNDGKLYSPGASIPHSFNDNPETACIVLDTETDEISYIDTHSDFLKFETVNDNAEKTALEQTDTNAVIRVKNDLTFENLSESIHPNEILAEYLKELPEKSKTYIETVLSTYDKPQIKETDMQFELQYLKGQNFLSIQNIDFDFTKYSNLTVIQGDVGAGKSSLFKFIYYMFYGKLPGIVKANMMNVFAPKRGKIIGELSLKYKNADYLIKRVGSTLEVFENGTQLQCGNKRDIQAVLTEKLEFLNFPELIFVEQTSNGIFAGLNDSGRVQFLKKILDLDKITNMHKRLHDCLTDLDSKINNANASIDELKTRTDKNTEFIENNKNVKEYTAEVIEKLNSANSVLNSEIQELNLKISEAKIQQRNAKTNEEKKAQLTDKIEKLKNLISSIYENINKLDNNTFTHEQSQNLEELKSKYSVISSKYAEMKNHPDICPTCKQSWVIPNLSENLSKFELALDKLGTNIQSLNAEKTAFESTQTKSAKLHAELESNQKLLQYYETELSQINSVKYEIQDCADFESKLSELQSKQGMILKELGSAEMNNRIYQQIQNAQKENLANISNIQNLSNELNNATDIRENVKDFNEQVLSDRGLLIRRLLDEISEKLNTDENIQVKTTAEQQNGRLVPTLNLALFVPEYNRFIDYDMLSGGQKLQADIRFLKCVTRILGKISNVFFDEIFKYLSDNAIIEMSEYLKNLDIQNIYLTLHGNLQQSVADNNIFVRLTEHGSIYE